MKYILGSDIVMLEHERVIWDVNLCRPVRVANQQ